MSQQATKINEQIDRGGLLLNKQKEINDYGRAGGASRPEYIGSISTYIKKVYKSSNKKR